MIGIGTPMSHSSIERMTFPLVPVACSRINSRLNGSAIVTTNGAALRARHEKTRRDGRVLLSFGDWAGRP